MPLDGLVFDAEMEFSCVLLSIVISVSPRLSDMNSVSRNKLKNETNRLV